LRFGI